jgi:hypothetical protein
LESFEKLIKEDNIMLRFDAFEDLQELDEFLETCVFIYGTMASYQCFRNLIHILRPSPLEITRVPTWL